MSDITCNTGYCNCLAKEALIDDLRRDHDPITCPNNRDLVKVKEADHAS